MLKLFLRFFFHHLYHSLAWAYDLVAFVVSLGRWNRWTYSVLPYIQGRRVLELGYGTGHLQLKLIQHGFQTFGLDESLQMASIAGHRLRNAAAPESAANLVRACGDAIPFCSETFDTAVASFPAPYIARLETLAEIHRVLRPDGSLVILLAAVRTGRSPLERIQAWLFRVTGESPEIDEMYTRRLLTPFQQSHFDARVEWLQGKNDRLLIILAQK